MTSQWGFTFLTLYLFRLFAALPSKPLSTKLFSAGQGACFMGSWVRYLRYTLPPKFFSLLPKKFKVVELFFLVHYVSSFKKNAQIVLYFHFISSSEIIINLGVVFDKCMIIIAVSSISYST